CQMPYCFSCIATSLGRLAASPMRSRGKVASAPVSEPSATEIVRAWACSATGLLLVRPSLEIRLEPGDGVPDLRIVLLGTEVGLDDRRVGLDLVGGAVGDLRAEVEDGHPVR